jgi:hypothetical protein
MSDDLVSEACKIAQAFADALNPDKMKNLLIGEFEENTEYINPDGEHEIRTIPVSWQTTKDIMAAILEQAQLNAGWSCSECGSSVHILHLRDCGHISCCPDRKLSRPKKGVKT